MRPPGHHAGLDGPQGFCLFNNVAIATKHVMQKYPVTKIVIIDWDVHHGNGTQEIFYKDNRVLFISVHRQGNGFYPGSDRAFADYVGEDDGKFFNVNICLKHGGVRDVDYITIWEHTVIPIIKEFGPNIILISAGFDAAEGDELGECKVTPAGFATMLDMLTQFGRIVMILEGGYDLDALSTSVSSCVRVLLGDKGDTLHDKTALPYATTWESILETREALKPFWEACRKDIPEDVIARSIPVEQDLYGQSH